MSSVTPKTIKHNNRSQNRDFNIYTEEYFGGSDAFIYIDGKREHNIAHIQFTVQEQHKPIYGYGSRTFDDLAVGNRIVVGALKIPLKNLDNSDFNDEWGKSSESRMASPRVNVPSWVYNYTPPKENNAIVVKNENKDELSMVAKVQKKLGINPNGFVDENTRNTINSYRKNNSMMLGTLIDNELISSLGIEDYNCYPSKKINVYDSPARDRILFTANANEKLVFIASDKNMALVRNTKGKSGYIDTKDVYRT